VQAAADKVLIKGKVNRPKWFDKEAYAFELTTDEKARFEIEIADVPARFISQSRAFAAEKKQKITDADIVIAYKKELSK
jgi:hypothetical protein